MHKSIHSIAILTAVCLTLSFSGCTQPVAEKPSNKDPKPVAAQETESAAPEQDIATQPNTLPEKDATAKLVCERFLALLSQGERSLAEQLLSSKALKATIAAGLELEPMGGEGAVVKVGEALYATSRAEVAQVPCTVTEKDGTSQSLQWMMRRGESGWRIAGLIIESGGSTEFLSLENKADVAAIVKSRGGDVTTTKDIGLVSHESE